MSDLLSQSANYIGVLGVLLTLIAYYYLNINRFKADDLSYLLLNFFGSWLILFSLMFHWNLSSVIIEIAWISISTIGLVRVYLKKESLG